MQMQGSNIQQNNRNSNYDLARIISMVFVVMIHTPVKPFRSVAMNTILLAILYVSNGIFYMASGRFNLSKVFETPGDYAVYYKKRFISIGIPYIFISLLQTLLNIESLQNVTLISVLSKAYGDIMSENSVTHLWFMYPLIGFIVSTPFLSKMYHAMKDAELNILFIVALIWNFISIYLVTNLGFGFAYKGWFLSEWAFYYFLGYYYSRTMPLGNKEKMYFAGLIGFLITVIGKLLFSAHFYYWSDIQIGYTFFISAVYIFLIYGYHIKGERIKRVIGYLARYTYLVYLIHYEVMLKITNRIIRTNIISLNFLANTLITLILSLIAAIILDKIFISPLKKLTGRFLKVS